ncbi:MAG TPA: hypothetical protein VK203_08105 [Nostocaceae cyanobacterium]|nr:hypothetical protein [Nostocaceae cyanobacterium]
MKIPEVWFCNSGQLRVFSLQDEKYQEVSQSQLLLNLDLALLLKYVGHPDQYDAVQEFLTEVREGK